MQYFDIYTWPLKGNLFQYFYGKTKACEMLNNITVSKKLTKQPAKLSTSWDKEEKKKNRSRKEKKSCKGRSVQLEIK